MTNEFERQREIVAKLNIIDDTFFHKMVEDKGVCEEMIRTFLEDENIEVVQNMPQRYLRNTGARSVVLDVLCKDTESRLMNIEVQKADDDDHQKRVRYHAANIDTFMTEKGMKYNKIPDVYIIYICRFDVFGRKKTAYHIDRTIRETGEVVENGIHEIYLNAKQDDGSDIADLLQYMMNTQGENRKFPRISKQVRYFKEEQEGVSAMCELVEEYAKERAEEAKTELNKKTARELFRNGVSYEIVRKSMTDLEKEVLDQIYAEVMEEKKQ